MKQLIWVAIAWVGGTAAILGSLMLLGSLLLWLIPADQKIEKQAASLWQGHLKLLAVALGLMLSGIGLLMLFPFPIA